MSDIAKVSIIEFDERPALDHEIASEQLEHLYIHVGMAQEKLNELIERYAVDRRELLDRLEHLERRMNAEWPYAAPSQQSPARPTSSSVDPEERQ